MKNFLLILVFVAFGVNVSYSQSSIELDLPYTWRESIPNNPGFMEYTLCEDGTLVTRMCMPCFLCQGMGVCGVCHGTGQQFFNGGPGFSFFAPCPRCSMNPGRCGSCFGRGYTITTSFSKYGMTIGYDEHGNMYIPTATSSGRGSESESSSSKRTVEEIYYPPTFGVEANYNVYCETCGKVGKRHVHIEKVVR